MKVLFIIIITLLGIIVMPLLTIWALNTLFGLGIAYSFKTWLSAAIVLGILSRVTVRGSTA